MLHVPPVLRIPGYPLRLRGAATLAWSAVAVAVAGVSLLASGARATAAEPVAHARGDRDSAADIARLDRQLRELRTTLGDVQRSERDHFEIIRLLLEKRGPSGGAATAGAATPGEQHASATDGTEGSETVEGAVAASASPSSPGGPPRAPAPLALTTVTGHVTTRGPLRDVYVYLEGFRSNAGRKAELEIVQTHKSFEPTFAVALAGTRATFPNRDTFFHNVFSLTPVPFDLGTYRADEKAPSVTLSSPGVVEIFCNIHAQMQAQVLVVPNRVFARVADDGTFRLDKVPAGRRKLVAWGPGLRPVRLDIVVPASGARVAFELEPAPPTHHTNKFGLPYGAYKD